VHKKGAPCILLIVFGFTDIEKRSLGGSLFPFGFTL